MLLESKLAQSDILSVSSYITSSISVFASSNNKAIYDCSKCNTISSFSSLGVKNKSRLHMAMKDE